SLILAFTLASAGAEAGEPTLSLADALERALAQNPKIASIKASAEGQESKVSSNYAPASPMIGLSELNRGNSTLYATVSQRIDFPTKYFLRADRQDSLAKAQRQKLAQTELDVRSQVIRTYYALYTVERI